MNSIPSTLFVVIITIAAAIFYLVAKVQEVRFTNENGEKKLNIDIAIKVSAVVAILGVLNILL